MQRQLHLLCCVIRANDSCGEWRNVSILFHYVHEKTLGAPHSLDTNGLCVFSMEMDRNTGQAGGEIKISFNHLLRIKTTKAIAEVS